MARLAFFGSPAPAAYCLTELARAGHEIVVVVTGPDRRRERGGEYSPTPVKRAAERLGVDVTDQLGDVLSRRPDLGVVVAYGRLIPAGMLEHLTMVNAHFSLLPRWRGAAPVERAILAGDAMTGLSLMALERGLDTGPVYEQVPVPIRPHESAASLTERLTEVAAQLLVRRLAHGREGLGEPVPQQGDVTYASKISPAERRIEWKAAGEQIERLVRVGRAFTTFRERRLIIWEAVAAKAPAKRSAPPGRLEACMAATGDGWLELRVVQPEGRPRLAAAEWARGARIAPGESLS